MWDAVAKIEGKPLHRVLAERYNGGKVVDKVFCYVGGGWYAPGKTTKDLQDEMRRHLDAGYTMVKMKVGGMTARRGHAPASRPSDSGRQPRRACGRRQLQVRPRRGAAYAKALSPYKLRWFEEPCDPLDYATLAEIAERL